MIRTYLIYLLGKYSWITKPIFSKVAHPNAR